MPTRITIRKPDDWHLHVRDGEMLKAVLPYTAKDFGRAILMPNLTPPVRTTRDAMAYRQRVKAALPPGSRFQPLMTCYLTDDTDADDVERGFRDGVFTGVKLYPANATTNSAAGVTDYRNITGVLERMEKIDMPFLMHGEEVGGDRYFRPRGGVCRAPAVAMGEAISRPAHGAGACFLGGWRRLRQGRRAAGRRHHHALPFEPDAHRLARRGAQTDDVRDAGHQDRPRPRGAA